MSADLEYDRCGVCASGIKRQRRNTDDDQDGPWLHVVDGRAFSRAIRPHIAAP